LKTLTAAYSKAPHFKKYLPLLQEFYGRSDSSIADLTIAMTVQLAQVIGISNTRFLRSSELDGISGQKTARLIQILTRVGGTHYISGPSAREYIEEDQFRRAGISLEYMTYDYPEYTQLYPPYDPFVSILDLLFMTGERALEFIDGREMLAHGSQ
jgi:hypothetical protein